MASGADDYIRKPFNSAELVSRVKAGLRVIELENKLVAKNEELEIAYSALSEAVEAAGRVQRRMLPDDRLLSDIQQRLGIQLAYKYQSCEGLGGDIFGSDVTRSDHLAIFMGDVSGHGIAASLSAVSLYAVIRASLRATPDPVQVIHMINRYCYEEFPDEVYATLIYLLLKPSSGTVQGIIAGHPPLIKLSPAKDTVQLEAHIPPLGLFEDAVAAVEPVEIVLEPGERLLAYTDGLIETKNKDNELFSLERLVQRAEQTMTTPCDQVPDVLTNELDIWRGKGVPASDDLTIMLLEMNGIQH
jgi:sigma-B regulation protein RsbU (phosphoserine phosphatase)